MSHRVLDHFLGRVHHRPQHRIQAGTLGVDPAMPDPFAGILTSPLSGFTLHSSPLLTPV
jgi:hypothetical protein